MESIFKNMSSFDREELVRNFVGDDSFYLSVDVAYDYNEDDDWWEPVITSYEDARIAFYNDLSNLDPYDLNVSLKKYSNDWSLLMNVISKITTNDEFIGNEYRETIMDIVPFGNLSDIFEAVCMFIIWFNNNNSNQHA